MGTSIAANLDKGDQVKVDKNVITVVAVKADRDAAKLVDDKIAALTFADEANPTAGEIAAVKAARTSYTNLTPAQKALVTKLSVLEAKEAIVSGSPAVAEAAAVKAVKDAVTENDKAKFIAALKNPLFTKYIAANDDAYWTAKAAISAPATTALMDDQLVIVNNSEAAAAVEKAKVDAAAAVKTAATSGSKADLLEALADSHFAASYVAANDDAYWTAKDSFAAITAAGVDGDTDVAEVIAVLDQVNVDEVAATIVDFAVTGAVGDTVELPTVPAGYTVAFTSSATVGTIDASNKLVATGTSVVTYTVTHTASTATATATPTVTVTVTP